MSIEVKRQTLRAIWRNKMHVEPRALELSSAMVRAAYRHIWEPAQIWMRDLERFPPGLLRVWKASERGHLVFTHGSSGYRPGLQLWHDSALESVCYLSLTDIQQHRKGAMLAQLHLFDHLLGSRATENEPWLSDGEGITEGLHQVALRFVRLHALGYGADELGLGASHGSPAHDYFAHTLWLYLADPRRLNVIHPLLCKLYRSTLMREDFWRNV